MERIKLYIHIKENGYGEKLMRFVAGQQNPYIEVELLTEMKEKTKFERNEFLVSDDPEVLQGSGCNTVQIVKSLDEEAGNNIFMYQNREKIYEKLLEAAGAAEWKRKEKRNAETKVICVFSPGGGDERTALALYKARKSAEQAKVLYISLCEFPVFAGESFGERSDVSKAGLSELISCAGSSTFEEKLKELVFQKGHIWMVAPAENYKDLLDYPVQEMMQFMQKMKEQKAFNIVIFEIGRLFEYTLEFLAEADEVFVPEETTFFAGIRRALFKQYCIREGWEKLWERVRFTGGISCEKESGEVKRLLCEEEGGGAYEQKRRQGAKGTDTPYGTRAGSGGS